MPDTAILPFHGSYLMPALEHATVADTMHRGVLTCRPDATLTEVARMMSTHHVHCMAVMGLAHEGNGESLVWGLIFPADLVKARLRSPADDHASSLAREPIVGVEPTMPLRQAAALMLERGTDHLIVIGPQTQLPVGVLSMLDIAGVLAWGEA